VLDLPGVGENLQDHLQVRLVFKTRERTLNDEINNPLNKLWIGMQYLLSRTGPLTLAASQVAIFTRSGPGVTRPDIQFHMQPLSADKPGEGAHRFSAFTSSVCQLRPFSRGRIAIRSANVGVYPAIQPNYLSDERDYPVVIGDIKLACSGAGAAAIACLDLMVSLGLNPKNVFVADSKGVIYVGRDAKLDPSKARYAQDTAHRTLGDITAGADVFMGLSTAGVLKPEMVKSMAPNPIILAMANPVPEIMPDEAKKFAAVVGTGRSDFPNQINNALAFPGVFRGALDAKAVRFTNEMKIAAARALAACVEPTAERILPGVLDKSVAKKIAEAVKKQARAEKVVRK